MILQALSLFLAVDVHAYGNYAELAAREREGTDYRIELVDRSSPTTVLAIHGGRIEPGTTELATRIAELRSWNLYSFLGLLPGQSGRLHITSHLFDEPRAVTLAERSEECVSVHGFAQVPGRPVACIGGLNERVRDAVAARLRAPELGITVEVPCRRYEGRDPMNIVNRCRAQGVQLELNVPLRERVLADPEFAGRLAQEIANAL
jgi:phage replication-related protein YjqB (UPF0714/DUF867 family)